MAAAQLDEPDNSGMAPCEEEADDYPMEEEEDDDFFVQLGATYWCRRADGSYRDGEVVKLRMNKRAGREEYLVHYVGLTRRQAEWVDKTRLMLSKPIKQEDMENGTDQKISEIGKAIQNQRSDEDKPEAKKAKLYTSAVVPKNKEITCLLCNELYKDPVMVQCGHSFCRSCINEAWANRDSVSCPDCSKVVTERNVTANFALAYILKTTVGDAVKPAEKVKAYSDVNCPKHDEKLKLYCMDDGILGCIICRDSLKHNGHTFLPIVDAVEMYQAKLSSVRNPLEEACKKSIELNVQQSEKVEQLQNTITECRQHIWSEFGNLYSFLKERKKNLLQQLQEQGPALLEELETYAAKLKQNRDSVKECMVVANKKMYETEPATFLDGMEDFVMKAREQLEEVNLTLSGMRQKQLCRGTFNGPVQFFTWKQMKSIIPVADHEEQPEPPKQEEVPESSSDAAVINDSVPDNGEQPVPPRQEEVPKSPMDPPVICNSVPEYGQQPVSLMQEKVPEGPMDLPVIKDSVPECENQPEQKEVSECPMDLPVIQENGAKEVWIIGNNYMTAINQRAQDGLLDLNLGFKRETCTIHWFSLNNRCESFFGRLKDATRTLKPPDVLLFHSGYSDLSCSDFILLIKMVTTGLTKAAKLFPNTQFILSALYPKILWQQGSVKLYRQQFYTTLSSFSGKPGFNLLEHNQLAEKLASRSLTEDVSVLKDDEIELFILRIQNALLKKFPSATEKFWYTRRSSGLFPLSEPAEASAEKVTIAENVQQLAVVEKQEAPEAPADPSGPKGVWIVGDSFIYKAASWARSGDFGENIGFDRANWSIHWMGSTNLWTNVLSDLFNVSCKQGMPSIVFLHIGSDELEVIQCSTLINVITYAIGQLVKLYPKTHFIFSTILPKLEWLSNIKDHNRMRLNKVIGEYVETLGVEVAKNARLEAMLLKRFQLGRVYNELTLQENVVFLTNIRLVLFNAILKVGKTAIENQEPKKQVLHTGGTLTVVVSESQPVTNEEVPSVPDSPALPNASGVKQIWIVGNSYICRAARQANGSSYGSNMGFDLEKWKVNWFGRVAMRWEALLPELKHALSTFGAPNIVFVHLGDNDLGCMPYGTLTNAIAEDIAYLAKQFPKTEFIFSTIFPRAEWLTNPLEQNRKDVNIFLSTFAGELGFLAVVHDNVEEVAIPRFKSGGSNVISDSEFNMFMNSIREALEKVMLKVEKAICMTLVHQYSLGSV